MFKKIFAIAFGLIMLICSPNSAMGFDDQVTHPAITEKAATDKQLNLDDYLMNKLGFKSKQWGQVLIVEDTSKICCHDSCRAIKN